MKVLIAHNDYGRFSGEEAAIEALASVLTSRGHEVRWHRRTSSAIADTLAGHATAFFSGIYNPFSRATLARMLAKERFDLVQVQNLYPLLSPSILLACREAGVPVVMRCPNYRLLCPSGLHLRKGAICERCLRPWREWHCIRNNCEGDLAKSTGYALRNSFARLSGLILDNVDRFLVLSEFQKQRFQDAGISRRKIAVLPNIAPIVRDEDLTEGGGFVGFAGRLSQEKGIVELLAAARRLPHIPFELAGELGDVGDLLGQAPANVKFHGFLRGEALDRFFAESRLFVVPSLWWEGFPNVAAKAMAHAKPIVASDLGALAEIVEHERTGYLFEAGDSAHMAEMIQTLWNSPGLSREMGRQGLEKSRRDYSEDEYYRRLIGVYQELLA